MPGSGRRSNRPDPPVAPLRQADRVLQVLMWLSIGAVGLLPTVTAHVRPAIGWARPSVIAVFFLAAVLRVGATALHRNASRTLPLMMAAALTCFGTGSLVLALHPELVFPSVAELFFAAAYLCFIGYLVLDTTGRTTWSVHALLETGVAAGGIVSAALFVVVTPLAATVAGGDVRVVLALIYPLSDVVLITIVLTQLATRRRALDQRTCWLLAGLLGLAAVDSSFPLGLGGGDYTFSTLQDVVWAAALAALADSAARPVHRAVSRNALGTPGPAAAGLCAVVVLAVERSGASSLIHWPAVLTMILSFGLLLSSLRTARSAAEAQRLSLTDDLTGLANRRAVVRRLADRRAGSTTLLLLDLNGFKAVNDAFGHPEGDRLLVRVGQRLRDSVPDLDLVARLGGDEFAVICEAATAPEVTRKAESILARMREPLAVADLGLTVGVAIGIASSTSTRPDDDLLRRADVAMYRAKSSGAGFCWYDPGTDDAGGRLHLIEELRLGITRGQLRAFFQPQIDAADGALVGVEALVRWEHPERGLLAPADFLASARSAGLMLPLSLEMMRLCVAQAAEWADAGLRLRMSLNVDPPELLSGAWGPALVTQISRAGLDPAMFTVELTEELLVSDPHGAATHVRELARHGIEVSIDDYGTGYSGLAWLQSLPVRELKLDRSFVGQVLGDSRTRTIVESTVRLANELQLRVVAEGVEDQATADAMTGMGVDLLQGYHVCRPVRAPALDDWLAGRATREAPTVPRSRAPEENRADAR